MRRLTPWKASVPAAIVVALCVAAAPATAAVSNQTLTASGGPTKLPKSGPGAPVALTIAVAASFSAPSTDPAATQVDVDFPSEGQINTEGQPSCDPAKLAQTTTAQATAACGAAQIGSVPGIAHLNGVVGAQTGVVTTLLGTSSTILLHIRVDALSITQVLVGQVIDSPLGGIYGKRLSVPVPAQQIGGGHEILTDLTTTIDKKFTVKKKVKGKKTKVKSGILTSNCKADRLLSFQGTFLFTQFAATGIPAGPGPTFVASSEIPCTPAKVKKKK
jgi:hypothetical protein